MEVRHERHRRQDRIENGLRCDVARQPAEVGRRAIALPFINMAATAGQYFHELFSPRCDRAPLYGIVGKPAGNESVVGNLFPIGAIIPSVAVDTTSPLGMVRLMAGEAHGSPRSFRRAGQKKKKHQHRQSGTINSQFSPLKNMATIVKMTITPKVMSVMTVTNSWSRENHCALSAARLGGSQGRARKRTARRTIG